MLKYILFCVDYFWFVFICFQKSYLKNVLEKEEKEKKASAAFPLACSFPPPRPTTHFLSSSAQPADQPNKRPKPRTPLLSFHSVVDSRVPYPLSLTCGAHETTSSSRIERHRAGLERERTDPGFLRFPCQPTCHAYIKLPNPPRRFPFASKPTNSCPSRRFLCV